jgi:hypothetical protein
VTNFFNLADTNTILLTFSSSKLLILEGFHSYFLLADNEVNMFYLSAKIPYCLGDDKAVLLAHEKTITIACELYQSDGTTLISTLTDCTIAQNTMSYPTKYKLKVIATNPSEASQTITKWANIDTKMSNITVFIHGGNRAVSLAHNNNFFANVNPFTGSLIYRWS